MSAPLRSDRRARATCSPAPTRTSPIWLACSIGASTPNSPMLSAVCSAKSTMSSCAFGIIDDQVAQQDGGPLDIAPALLEQLQHLEVASSAMKQGHGATIARPG